MDGGGEGAAEGRADLVVVFDDGDGEFIEVHLVGFDDDLFEDGAEIGAGGDGGGGEEVVAPDVGALFGVDAELGHPAKGLQEKEPAGGGGGGGQDIKLVRTLAQS